MTDLNTLSPDIIEEVLEKTAYTIIENIPHMKIDNDSKMTLLIAIKEKVELIIHNLAEVIENE